MQTQSRSKGPSMLPAAIKNFSLIVSVRKTHGYILPSKKLMGKKCFEVSTSTVYRLSGQKKKTGSVELQTSRQGRKPTLTEEDLLGIDQLIIGQPDITIDEIIEKQGLSVSNETVRKAVIRLGYVYKKKSFYAAERDRVRCCGGERSLERNAHAMRRGYCHHG